nr:uncharacterized protein LOC109785886 isoform X1 [Aegilops tauschii subsp. strangulata]
MWHSLSLSHPTKSFPHHRSSQSRRCQCLLCPQTTVIPPASSSVSLHISPLHASSSPSSPHSRSPLPIDLVPGFVAPADGGAETCRGRSRCVHGGRRGGWGIRVAASTSRSSSSCSASPSSSTRCRLCLLLPAVPSPGCLILCVSGAGSAFLRFLSSSATMEGLLLVQRLPGDPISGLHCTKRNCLRASCCGRTLCFISHTKSMGKAGAGNTWT